MLLVHVAVEKNIKNVAENPSKKPAPEKPIRHMKSFVIKTI